MTEYLQASFDGLALGALYALIVLGFVVIYRATGIINFAQGGALLLGAYLTYNGVVTWNLNFWVALAISIVATAAFNVLLAQVLLQRQFRYAFGVAAGLFAWSAFKYNGWSTLTGLVGGLVIGAIVFAIVNAIEARWGAKGPSELPVFGAIMVTIGILFAIKQVIPSIWGVSEVSLPDPWEINSCQGRRSDSPARVHRQDRDGRRRARSILHRRPLHQTGNRDASHPLRP